MNLTPRQGISSEMGRALGLALLILCAPAARAWAQSGAGTDTAVDANVMWLPAGPTDLVTMRSALVGPHLNATVGAVFGYQHRPVVLSQNGTHRAAVKNQFTGDLLFGFGLIDKLQVGVGLSTVFVQRGYGVSPVEDGVGRLHTDVAVLRDLRITGDWLAINRGNHDGVGLLFSAGFNAPTGDQYVMASWDQWTLTPAAVVDYAIGHWLIALNTAVRIRTRDREVGAARLGTSVVAELGGAYRVLDDRLTFVAEGHAVLQTEPQPPEATRKQHAFELDLGARYLPERASEYVLVGSVGAGIGGFGAPTFRILFGLEYAFSATEPPAP